MLLFFPNSSHHSNICRGPANCFERHLTRSSWRKKEWVNALKWKMKVKYITFLEYSSCKIEKKGYLQWTNMHFFVLCWRDLVRLQTSGYSTWDWSEIRKTLWGYISGQSERIPICNWTFNVCIDWKRDQAYRLQCEYWIKSAVDCCSFIKWGWICEVLCFRLQISKITRGVKLFLVKNSYWNLCQAQEEWLFPEYITTEPKNL